MNKRAPIILAAILLIVGTALAAPSATLSFSLPTIKEGTTIQANITVTLNESINGTIIIYSLDGRIDGDDIIGGFAAGTRNYNTSIYAGSGLGAYSLIINLSDSARNIIGSTTASGNIVDGSAPSVSVGPSGAFAVPGITIYANANEDATCRYSSEDKDYSLMENTMAKSGLNNTAALSFGDGSHRFYVRCINAAGNKMAQSATIEFSVATETYADIVLSKESPLSAGIVEVRVLASKSLSSLTLSYYYSDAPTTISTVPLSGAGTLWQGYVIIPETSETRIGTFTISGTDGNGNAVSKIGAGKLFIIDTKKPKEITDIGAVGESYRIRLKWFYEGEAGKFNIYRAESGDVSYVDLYDSSNESHYIDRSVNPGKTYHYRIAAVTQSGNVGPLSSAVSAEASGNIFGDVNDSYIISKPKKQDEERIPAPPEERKNSAYVMKKIDERLSSLASLILDIERAEDDFNRNDDTIERSAIDGLGLKDIIADEKENVVGMRKDLETYRATYIEEESFNRTIEFMDVKLKKTRLSIPKKIVIIDKTSFIEKADEGDILYALNAILNESEVKSHLSSNIRFNGDIKVEVSYKAVRLTMLDGGSEERTLVEKLVSYPKAEPARKVTLVESVPRSVAQSSEDIIFRTRYIRPLSKNAVAALELDELGYEPAKLTYVLFGKKDIEEIRKTRTIAIRKEDPGRSALTGLAIFSGSGGASAFDLAILGGVVLLIALIGYYFMFVRERPLDIRTKEMHGPLPGARDDARDAYQEPPAGRMNFPAVRREGFPAKIERRDIAKTGEIKRLMNEAHFYIDAMNYDEARRRYESAVFSYSGGADVPMQERSEMDATMLSLYSKLMLVSKISEAHNHIERKDKYSAEIALSEVSRLYRDVASRGRSTDLANYAYQWSNHLGERLRTL